MYSVESVFGMSTSEMDIIEKRLKAIESSGVYKKMLRKDDIIGGPALTAAEDRVRIQ